MLHLGNAGLELFNSGAGAILVFLSGPTANAAGTDQDTLAENRHGALAIEHVAAFGRGDAAQGRVIGPGRQIATGASEGSRGHSLALAAKGASPHGAIHALKGKEPSAGVAHGDIHLRADLVCLLDGAGDHAIGIREGEGHEVDPFRSEIHVCGQRWILSRRSECSGASGRVVAIGMNKISYAGYRFPVPTANSGIVTLALVRHFWPLPEPAKSLEMLQRHQAKRAELGVNSANVTMPSADALLLRRNQTFRPLH